MKKFEQALLDAEKQNSLKRVKLKLDPKIREAQDYSQYEGYEGYVLSETETHVELQINDHRITLPKMVLENRLKDFLQGAAGTFAPGATKAAKNLYNKYQDAKNYYYTDPNASPATKVGRGVGKAANVAASLLNPMTTLKAGERIFSAPARFIGDVLGVDKREPEKTQEFGEQSVFSRTPMSQLQVATTYIQAITGNNAAWQGHIAASINAASDFNCYTVRSIDAPLQDNNLLVIGANVVARVPGSRISSNNYMPLNNTFGRTTNLKNVIKTTNAAPASGTTVDINAGFFTAMQEIADQTQADVSKEPIENSREFVFEVLDITTNRVYQVGGYVTDNRVAKQAGGPGTFTLSQNKLKGS